LQFDPPTIKTPIPWRAISLKSGSLRLLNCTISESNKQGIMRGVVEEPGRFIVRNSMFFGGKAAMEIVANDEQELVVDNSVIFSNAGVLVSSDVKAKKTADLSISI